MVKLAIALLLVLLVGGVVAVFVSRLRHAARRIACTNNLRQIGLALDNYHDTYEYFPTGTVPNTDLDPEKRLGWIVFIWPTFMEGGCGSRFDMSKAWDSKENCPPRFHCKKLSTDHSEPWDVEIPAPEARAFYCPANPNRGDPELLSPTHYLGIAGLGDDAAELPVADARAGFFGYDRKISREDIKDGASMTMAVAEGMKGGPWSAGGRATVRGLRTGDAHYLGERGQFTSLHRDASAIALSPPVVTNVLFADASVRSFTAKVSPQVFEALATIAGKEEVGPLE